MRDVVSPLEDAIAEHGVENLMIAFFSDYSIEGFAFNPKDIFVIDEHPESTNLLLLNGKSASIVAPKSKIRELIAIGVCAVSKSNFDLGLMRSALYSMISDEHLRRVGLNIVKKYAYRFNFRHQGQIDCGEKPKAVSEDGTAVLFTHHYKDGEIARHMLDVARMASTIINNSEHDLIDKDAVLFSALFHDLSKADGIAKRHGFVSAGIVGEFMDAFKYSNERRAKIILNAIEDHMLVEGHKTLEAFILRQADNINAILTGVHAAKREIPTGVDFISYNGRHHFTL